MSSLHEFRGFLVMASDCGVSQPRASSADFLAKLLNDHPDAPSFRSPDAFIQRLAEDGSCILQPAVIGGIAFRPIIAWPSWISRPAIGLWMLPERITWIGTP